MVKDYIDLSDELKGQEVKVEVQLKSGSDTSRQTLLYWGTYEGTGFVGSKEVIVLTGSGHYSRAGVHGSEGSKAVKITAKKTCINLEDMISIDLNAEWKE